MHHVRAPALHWHDHLVYRIARDEAQPGHARRPGKPVEVHRPEPGIGRKSKLIQINTPSTGDGSLLLSNNAHTGGTCFGDSGGPNFIGSSNVVGGVTSAGGALFTGITQVLVPMVAAPLTFLASPLKLLPGTLGVSLASVAPSVWHGQSRRADARTRGPDSAVLTELELARAAQKAVALASRKRAR